MEKEQQAKEGFENLTYTWMKSVGDFWSQSMAGMWAGPGMNFGQGEGKSSESAMEQWWKDAFKTTQAIYAPFLAKSWPQGEELGRKMSNAPEMLLGFAQMGLEGYLDFEKQWLQAIMMEGGPGASGEDLKKAPAIWMELFRKISGPLLNIPALGLTRSYQERMNQAVERFTHMSSDLTELVQQLYKPIEKASKAIGEHLEEMARQGKLSGESRESYNAWISTLERCYMDLLRSPEYIELLHRTVSGLSEYSIAKEEVLSDTLKFFPFPSNKDFDELSKEIYHLKKTLKDLRKRLEAQEEIQSRQEAMEIEGQSH